MCGEGGCGFWGRGVWSAKKMSCPALCGVSGTALPKGLRVLSLTYKKEKGNTQAHKLDLSK